MSQQLSLATAPYVPSDRDAIYTPAPLAVACVERLRADGYLPASGGWVVEPSVGGGAFARALAGHDVLGVDADPAAVGGRWCSRYLCADWLDAAPAVARLVDAVAVVGNPPFGGPRDAESYIGARHAVAALDVAPVVAMILPGAWLVFEGTEPRRLVPRDIWRACPPCEVVPIRGRAFGDALREAALYVWRRGHVGGTVVAERPIESALGWRS